MSNSAGRAGMKTVGFTRQRWSGTPKYRRIASSRRTARSSTEVERTSGGTGSETTSVEKKRRTIPRIGSSSSPRWSPITTSGRSSSTLWYLRIWP